jgi:RND family efflux transporter MFP subunit
MRSISSSGDPFEAAGALPGTILRLLLTLPALAFAVSCGSGQSAAEPQAPPPTVVELSTARPATIEDATEYVASLRSMRSTPIQPQVEGQVTRILVKSGDRVRTGDALVQIDASRQQAAVSSQQAEHAAREAAVSFARSRVERERQLYAAGATSREALEQAETVIKTAEAALRAQEAHIQEDQVRLQYFTVVAPTDGVVGDVPVRVGNQVTPQTVLTSIDQNDRLEVHVQVPIERAPGLRVGLPLRILGSDGAAAATTTVSFVAPSVDQATQTVLAKGLVTNPGSLRAQQFVRAQIVWKTSEGLLIPVLSVTRVNDQYFAFVAEEQGGALVARQRPVTLGPIVGDAYALLSGIKPDERIVVAGVQKIADGAPLAVGPPSGASQK